MPTPAEGGNPAAQRLEQGGHGQGGRGHGQAGVSAQQPAEAEHHAGVGEAEQHRQQPVGHRPADDAVEVVEPIAQDRRGDGQAEDRRRAEHGRADHGGSGPPVKRHPPQR